MDHAVPAYVGHVVFYEDFPYAHWEDFGRLEDLPADAFAGLPDGVSLAPEFADVSDILERKIRGDRAVREPDRPAVRRRRARWPTRCAPTRRGWRTSAGCPTRPPSGTGSRRRPEGRDAATGAGEDVPTGADPAAPVQPTPAAAGWTPGLLAALGAVTLAGIAIRLVLLPQPGLAGDLDQFVAWVHGIAVGGWSHAYDQNLSFPAVMAWVWGALAIVQPAFATVADASDPAIRALMKVPASLADLGLAAAVGWWFRDRPRLAVAAVAAVLLWPATWYVSAWWGQYESIYVLPAVLAVLAVRANRPGVAAALLAVSLMTKPQALPLAVPFAAWFLATQGWRGIAPGGADRAPVAVVAWLPFLAAGGPVVPAQPGHLPGRDLQRPVAAGVEPLVAAPGSRGRRPFVADRTALVGPLTSAFSGSRRPPLALVVFVGVYRRPSPERLAMGLAAISLGHS